MNFTEASTNICFYQLDGFFHRRIRIFLLPAVWPQMIAAENNAFACKSDFIGNRKNKFAKVCRCHSGITAKLIDLV
ncbi:Uncharacterised protein [Shigella sonnei]|nr:Uncharacterised protein [Shigella sonnei]CSG36339.1 Uncharacterised protein [Shigella sonnei]